MKRDHTGAVRGFIWYSQAWYSKNIPKDETIDSISIGMYHPGDGTSGEFVVDWIMLGGKLTPQLRVFDDAWSALAQFQDVLAAMAERDGENVTPEQMAALLLECGVVDQTQRESPYQDRDREPLATHTQTRNQN